MLNIPYKIDIPKVCPFCGSPVVFTSNAELYHGREYGNGKCYLCRNCRASVGVHNNSNMPLGVLANSEMKSLKMEAHALFDPLWKTGKMKRKTAYLRLSRKLGIEQYRCHFGWFDEEALSKAIEILKEGL